MMGTEFLIAFQAVVFAVTAAWVWKTARDNDEKEVEVIYVRV